MSDPVKTPTICLNMIVRNEAHIIHEVLDATAPYISYWVIVDTGSQDGTQQVIRDHMAALGIPGELHERPWRNFGHNRTEALALAQGHCDYIWVMDADDTIVGTPDFSNLDADVYEMLILQDIAKGWRPQMFRDGLPARYIGVVHEYPVCDQDHVTARIHGDFAVESRRLGGRNLDPRKYARDRDLLLAEVERNPDDTRSVFYLAQSYFDLEDYAPARMWYERRSEMGGYDEEVFYSLYRIAGSMEALSEPWPDVQAAYLRAWEFRPTRAEPLYCIAFAYRVAGRYALGHLFAKMAMELPIPNDALFVFEQVYTFRAADERAVCASWLGLHDEAFTLCRNLVALPDVPDDERQRIASNRDFSVPSMLETASSYPQDLAHSLAAGPQESEVTVSLRTGPDRAVTEQTLNTFLHCCLDVARVGRFLAIDTGLTAEDRALLTQQYPFLEFTDPSTEIAGRYRLQLDSGWLFFAPDNYITRLTGVLHAEPQVFQVGINFSDAQALTGTCAAEDTVRRTPDAGRYVLTEQPATGPAMVDTTRRGRVDGTATLDEVLCILG